MTDNVDALKTVAAEMLTLALCIDNDGTASQIGGADEIRGYAARISAAVEDGPGETRYRHKKRGTLYTLVGYGEMQSDDWMRLGDSTSVATVKYLAPVDMAKVAIYRSVENGSMWVRPIEEFEDGRFEVAPPSPTEGEAR